MDIEASGFGSGSYPIEIGVVLEDGDAYCRLVRRAAGWEHWDESAESIHGVARDILDVHGRDPCEIATDLNEMLWGKTVYSDAWSYDLSWLGLLFTQAGLAQTFRLESLRALLSEAQAERWSAVRRKVTQELGLRRHRASADARILQLTYLRVVRDGIR